MVRAVCIDAGWKDVPGYEGTLQAHPFGLIKRIKRIVLQPAGRHAKPWWRSYPEKIVKAGEGYRVVNVMTNGTTRSALLHRLIAMTFIPNLEDLPEVNHKDGCKHNNWVENLEWCTREQNALHSTRILKKNIGEMNGASVLTNEMVRGIKSHLDNGAKQTAIAELYGIHYSTVSKIHKEVNWKHIGKGGVNGSIN